MVKKRKLSRGDRMDDFRATDVIGAEVIGVIGAVIGAGAC